MKKDRTRDYATAAFCDYALNGFKTYEETRQLIYNAALLDASKDIKSGNKNPDINVIKRAEKAVEESTGYLLDILAVDKTLEQLRKNKKEYIIDVIKNVYFENPKQIFRKKIITDRVCRIALDMPANEATIYRYLKQARQIFAEIRGLNQ